MEGRTLRYLFIGIPKNAADIIDYAFKQAKEVNFLTEITDKDDSCVKTSILVRCNQFSAVYRLYVTDLKYTKEFDCLPEAVEIARDLSEKENIRVGSINGRTLEQATSEVAARRKENIAELGLRNSPNG